MGECVYCGNTIENKKRKYCNELCRYRYNSMKNEKTKKLSIAQHLRMARAGEKQRKGKIAVRYN